jgi:protein-tyrosine phosphatase
MIRVLFVCMGNICRSPMAEAVFQDRVNRAGLADQFQIDSAGTGGWHAGESAHRGTLAVLAQRSIPYDGRARQINLADFQNFDLIAAMDNDNLRAIRSLKPQGGAEVIRFLDVARSRGLTKYEDVPDPYYDNTFNRVYELVDVGSDALLDYLIRKYELQPKSG